MSTRRRLPPFYAVVLLLSLSQSPPPSASTTDQSTQDSNPISRFRNYLRINTAHPTAVNYLTAFAATIPTLQIRTIYLTTPDKPLLLIKPLPPAVLFNSHLDSFTAEPSKWLHHLFAADLSDDGKIYAREQLES